MKYMEWEPGFNFNIEAIDQQHRKLVDIINLLYETLHPATGKDELHALVDVLHKKATAINNMLEYAIKHFRYEEKLLQENNYPEYDEHKRQHESFTSQVEMYKKLFDSSIGVE